MTAEEIATLVDFAHDEGDPHEMAEFLALCVQKWPDFLPAIEDHWAQRFDDDSGSLLEVYGGSWWESLGQYTIPARRQRGEYD